MKKLLKKVLCLTLLCGVLLSTLVTSGATEKTEIMPRLVGIDAQIVSLSIDENGRALCGCTILADTGYVVNVTMTLERDGTAIKSWTGSGDRVDLAKPYYVTKNHDYQVVVTSRVSTAGGSYLLSYTLESQIESY